MIDVDYGGVSSGGGDRGGDGNDNINLSSVGK